MKKELSADQKKFLWLNLVLLGLALLFPLYYHWVFQSNTPLSHCFLKEWFGIYCPLCGGTRCIWELFHFRFLAALRYNAYVLLFVLLFLVWDAATLVRFLRGKTDFFKIPKAIPILLILLLALFFAVRTVLFFAYRIDPIGDLTAS